MEVVITWAPRSRAQLIDWVDDKELISPSPRSVFTGNGRIEFTYQTDDTDGYHEFEWLLAFPDKELRNFKAQVSWDGKTFHTVAARKESSKHRWAASGVAP